MSVVAVLGVVLAALNVGVTLYHWREACD